MNPSHWDFNTHLFASTFGLIFLAELPDKTAVATVLMATTLNPYALFIGVALAFVVQSLVAVPFGSLCACVPPHWIKGAAGILFVVFAWMMWKREIEEEEKESKEEHHKNFMKTIWSSFLVIFIAEWGDLTQLATATLTAQYQQAFTIFTAATLALWSTTALAIVIGNRAKHLINPRLLQKVGAVAFVLVGIYMLWDASQIKS